MPRLSHSGVLLEEEGGGLECRICLDDDSRANLIAPCNCKGGSKFVHRECLDHWRSGRPESQAFTHCMTCTDEFTLRLRPGAQSDPNSTSRRAKFLALMMRDTVGFFVALQVGVLVR